MRLDDCEKSFDAAKHKYQRNEKKEVLVLAA